MILFFFFVCLRSSWQALLSSAPFSPSCFPKARRQSSQGLKILQVTLPTLPLPAPPHPPSNNPHLLVHNHRLIPQRGGWSGYHTLHPSPNLVSFKCCFSVGHVFPFILFPFFMGFAPSQPLFRDSRSQHVTWISKDIAEDSDSRPWRRR